MLNGKASQKAKVNKASVNVFFFCNSVNNTTNTYSIFKTSQELPSHFTGIISFKLLNNSVN